MTQFTTDNIDDIALAPLQCPGLWRITFRSLNDGLAHQLYCNGQLVDWTASPADREFVAAAQDCPQQIAIAAVEVSQRAADFSALLDAASLSQPWVYRTAVVRHPRMGSLGWVALLSDHATGRMDEHPLAVAWAYPQGGPSWGWGLSPLGDGGFGFDAGGGPGLGMGNFGAGLFGVDELLLNLSAAFGEDGRHQVVLREVAADGSYCDGPVRLVSIVAPPGPPESFNVLSYCGETSTITLQIQ